MFRSVISRGWPPSLIAAFSAGQAERVVAHRAQHREAVPAAEVGDDVAERVVQDVAHVHPVGRRVREHLEHVEGALVRRGARRRVVDRERALGRPDLLPFRLDRAAGRMRSWRRRVVHRRFGLQRRKSLSMERPWGSCAALAAWASWSGNKQSSRLSSVTMVSACSQRFRRRCQSFCPTRRPSPTASCRSADCARRSSSSGSGRRSSSTTRRPSARRRGRTGRPRPDAFVVYGTKAFPSVAILRLLAEEGLGADVSTSGELAFALAAGIRGRADRRPRQQQGGRAPARAPAEAGALVVLDSIEEIARARAAGATPLPGAADARASTPTPTRRSEPRITARSSACRPTTPSRRSGSCPNARACTSTSARS